MARERIIPLELDLLCQKLEQDYWDKINASGKDEEARKSNFLSKAIAAFVLHEEALVSIDDAIAASIDGGQDHGIDSVFVDSSHVIWLIQSKYIASGTGEPELGDVSKFRDGIIDLLHGKVERFNNSLGKKKVR
ncbi:hypothetical protein ACFFHK_03360 [Gallibacterium trehalosifermentans]|uniref:Uncharacterized protein n=1 Tax=Gallibacterium trehalosifermentans TaxID=516935 RepID=A0ABV6H1V3_9PAST